jgi:hypothetical protein
MTVSKAEDNLPLNTLQRWMQTVLVNPLGTENGHPWQLLPENMQDDIEKIIVPSSRLTSRQRLAIYQRGYLARLRDCMAGQFHALQYALGQELFQAFADEYLQQYPSVSYTLTDLGRRFAGFLQATRPDADAPASEREDWPDFMIELAQLEYALLQIFDTEIDDNQPYATENTADGKLLLAPIFHVFVFRFPTAHYLQAVHRGETPALPFEATTHLAVTRKNYQLGLFHLNPLQYKFLQYLQTHPQPIPQALEQFSTINNSTLIDLQNLWSVWRTKWIDAGFFITQ